MLDGSGEQGALVRLASVDLAESAPEEVRRVILFQACDEWFALPIGYVREVQPLERVTRVPNAPRAVLGILNIRGRVVGLLDLARVFARYLSEWGITLEMRAASEFLNA